MQQILDSIASDLERGKELMLATVVGARGSVPRGTGASMTVDAAGVQCFGELQHLCRQLHLPVQAGNNRVLREMNRRYTREQYLDEVRRIREVCPDIGLSTDLIVGFPGETLREFEDTVSLVDEIRYDAAYTFIYSPRPGTRAASMPDNTPMEEKSRRIQLLIGHQQRITTDICRQQLGRVEPVLVEEVSARDAACVAGKTERGHMVNFSGEASLIGRIVPVKITSAGKNTLRNACPII